MTLAELLAAPPPSFSWPAGGIDGNAAPGLAVIGLTWGPQLGFADGEDESAQTYFVADTPAQPWTCGYFAIPPDPEQEVLVRPVYDPVVRAATMLPPPAVRVSSLPVWNLTVRAQPVLSVPPPRAAILVKKRR